MITSNSGQPSYTIQNQQVKVFISVQGGHLTASFTCREKEVCPFFIAPWWREARMDMDDITYTLRGDFFCFPFGANVEPYYGVSHPPHGKTANACWDLLGSQESEQENTLTLAMTLDPLPGSIEKRISISAGEPVIYQNHTIRDFQGKIPLGYHPTLQLPDRIGAAIIDISEPLTGFTTPVPVEEPQNSGYSQLQLNVEITDRSKVPCLDGNSVDLTRYPRPKGFEDIVMFINDPSKDFTFTAASVVEEGYLYFQLKNPRVLAQTMFWMSNGGRHYAPWNGRVTGVHGLEEVTAFYHYGIKPSIETNFFQEKGYKSYLEFERETPTAVKLIMGLIPIEKGFKGVQDIVRKNASTITIIGRGGEEIDVPCSVDFLLE
ncbi:MAG: hypothetical protein GY801_22160 [bacterium]|nr:hypothetical protein [bacterium]